MLFFLTSFEILGDFFKTPFPNVDLVTTSAVLRGFTPKERDELIAKCAKCVNPGMNIFRFSYFITFY